MAVGLSNASDKWKVFYYNVTGTGTKTIHVRPGDKYMFGSATTESTALYDTITVTAPTTGYVKTLRVRDY